jgi:hypothetical protein
LKVYAVIRPDGSIKRSQRSHHLFFYLKSSTAQRAATGDGDAVVEVDVDLDKAPMFIRGQKLDA